MNNPTERKVRLGVVGTSWWADAMHVPALSAHPLADIRGVVGTRLEHTREFARRWSIPAAYAGLEEMLAAEELEALAILAPNRHHARMTMMALDRGLHVLCEKPLALDAPEARRMVDAAERAGVITLVPFTYRFMPISRYLKELVEGGYLGRPFHLNLRYYTGYGRGGDYMWRFDLGEAGLGPAGDLGSHWYDMARWLFGEITAVWALFGHSLARGPRPDGAAYEQAEDSAAVLLEFANGATGSIHVSAVAHEPTPFGQTHHLDLHGSGGTLRAYCDWDRIQRVEGCRADESALAELPIPDHIFAGARRESVKDTYHDVFRRQDVMTRGFVSAVAAGVPTSPDFRDGLAVQRVIDAARRSAREGRRVTIAEIEREEEA